MPGKTMSDWEKFLRIKKFKKVADRIHTLKQDDIQRLKKSGLPQFEWFECPYTDFSRKNNNFMNFLRKYREKEEGFVVRLLPTKRGLEKGLTRKFRIGAKSLEEIEQFFDENIEGDLNLWEIALTNWRPQPYGGVIISGRENRFSVVGEVSDKLDKLTSGEDPFVCFRFDRDKLGYYEDKIEWIVNKSRGAKMSALKALRCLILGDDRFDPLFMRGYFEFVETDKGEIKFVDYKTNPAYLL